MHRTAGRLWTAAGWGLPVPASCRVMGLHTTFVGHVAVTPALAPGEVDLLRALNRTRRWDAPGGALRTAEHPADDPYPAEDHPGDDCSPSALDAHNRPAPGAPGLWCPWTACERGHCLHWDSVEKPYAGEAWLRWMIDTLLRPDADVAGTEWARRRGMTCDHVLAGVLIGERYDTAELFALEVSANVVRRRVLLPGVSEVDEWVRRGVVDTGGERQASLAARARRYERARAEDRAGARP